MLFGFKLQFLDYHYHHHANARRARKWREGSEASQKLDKLQNACSPAQIYELVHANILTEPTPRDTQQSHSSGRAHVDER